MSVYSILITIALFISVINCSIIRRQADQSALIYFDGEASRRSRPVDTSFRSADRDRCTDKNKRFHKETGRCYLTGTRGPCGNNMLFFEENSNSVYGDCDCKLTTYDVPYVYHPGTGQCYASYDQAYCSDKEWLVFDKDSKPVCEKRKCRKHEEHPNKVNVGFRGRCVVLNDKDTLLCSQDPLKQFIGFKPGEVELACTANNSENSDFNLGVGSLKCPPGSKRDFIGNCRSVVKNVNKDITNRVETSTAARDMDRIVTTMNTTPGITRPTVSNIHNSNEEEDYF